MCNTKIKTGIDFVKISEFKDSIDNTNSNILTKLFSEEELVNTEIRHLAGLFAAKEAAFKALGLKPGDWKQLKVLNEQNGRPYVVFKDPAFQNIQSFDLSISHSGDYVVAVFTALI